MAAQIQIHIRLSDEIAEGVDAYIEQIEKLTRVKHSRTDAVLSLITRGLETVTAKDSKK